MDTDYRYTFEKGSKKHRCPNCGKKRFVRYIDAETAKYLAEQYGRCDRESKCGYFLNPYKDGFAKKQWKPNRRQATYYNEQSNVEKILSAVHDKDIKQTYFRFINSIQLDRFLNPPNKDRFKEYVLFVLLKLKGEYKPEYDELFKVSVKGNREYNPATKLKKEFRYLLPFEVVQYDISRAYPSFIFEELGIDAFDVYQLIDKKTFNALLNQNHTTGRNLNEVREKLKPVYKNRVNEVLTDERFNQKGLLSLQMRRYEQNYIQRFVVENDLKKWVRIHDCILTLKEYPVKKLRFGNVKFSMDHGKLPQPKTLFYPNEVFKRTRAGYEQNIFIQNLLTRVSYPFEVQDIEKVISLYHLGTVQNGYRKRATTFPFIDVQGNVRAVQVKQFDEQNHTTATDFLHSIIEKHYTRNYKPIPEWLEAYNKNKKKVSCLFGEHLLSKYPYNPVALVESPKTAIYGTLYFGFPEQPTNLLWLAVYNLSSLNLNKCKALKGRNVYLFPDLSKDGKAFKLWSNKATEIQNRLQGTYFQVSDLLEQLAPQQDKEQGKDIADYLIKQDWRLFRKKSIKEAPQTEPKPVKPTTCEKSEKSEAFENNISQQNEHSPDILIPQSIQSDRLQNWNNEIAELEAYFQKESLPTKEVEVSKCYSIKDCAKFIESHLSIVKANNGKRTFEPYLIRLQEFKKVLISKAYES